jgi:hypothetical protein
MADENLNQRLTSIEARLEGIEGELHSLTELVTDSLAESRKTRTATDNWRAAYDLRSQMLGLRLQVLEGIPGALDRIVELLQRLVDRLDRFERGGDA